MLLKNNFLLNFLSKRQKSNLLKLKKTDMRRRLTFIFIILLILSAFSLWFFIPKKKFSYKSNQFKQQDKFLVFHLDKNLKKEKVKGFGYLMQFGKDGLVNILDRFPISYGQKGTHKEKRNDRKTPIGKYRIKKEFSISKKSKNFIKLGGKSLLLDYPNIADKKAKRTGSAITIHGGRTTFTLGCIRILDGTRKNPKFGRKNIEYLAKNTKIGTQVIISPNIHHELINSPKQKLSLSASFYWYNILKKDLNRKEIEKTMIAFNNNIRHENFDKFISEIAGISPQEILPKETKKTFKEIQNNSPTAWISTDKKGIKSVTYFCNAKQVFKGIKLKKEALKEKMQLKKNVRIKLHFEDGCEIVNLSPGSSVSFYGFNKKHFSEVIKTSVLSPNKNCKIISKIISKLEFL